MTRMVLCLSLSVLALALGLWTAGLQSHNHDRGLLLNDLKERCSMLESINGDQSAQILDLDCAALSPEPRTSPKPEANASAKPQANASPKNGPKPAIRARDAQAIAKATPRSAPSRGAAP